VGRREVGEKFGIDDAPVTVPFNSYLQGFLDKLPEDRVIPFLFPTPPDPTTFCAGGLPDTA
jgi:hypothetical protein